MSFYRECTSITITTHYNINNNKTPFSGGKSVFIARKKCERKPLITGTLFLWISAHLIVWLLSSPVLNLTFLLLPITSSHSHASASDSTFDYWR